MDKVLYVAFAKERIGRKLKWYSTITNYPLNKDIKRRIDTKSYFITNLLKTFLEFWFSSHCNWYSNHIISFSLMSI